MSFWWCITSHMVSGSRPTGFHMWTAKISEFLRGLSSKITSVGVLERIPPSVPIEFANDAHSRKRGR